MNKLYSQIASLIVIVGLGTAWVFNLITLETLGTGTTMLLALIYGLYQKYEQTFLESKNLELESSLKITKEKLTNLSLAKQIVSCKYDELQKSILKSNLVTTVSEIPLEVQIPAEKPKRRYYKSKKS